MIVSYNWLKKYVDVKSNPEVLAQALTGAGVAVDAVLPLNAGLKGAITGKLLSVERHPNANKLLVCQVDVATEVLTIVTGADNVAAGQIVPVGRVGTALPDGTVLGVADFRGIQSYGMLLSSDEMGIDRKSVPTHQRDGIYILPGGTAVGIDVAEVLELDDYCLELDLTPNRADCLSMLGVARETAAVTGSQVTLPVCAELGDPVVKPEILRIDILAPDLCSGYLGLVVDDVTVTESPLWLQNALRSVGLRPINNIVDVTNYVMWELGQPLHAFDYDRLNSNHIVVRRSAAGESIVTLDGENRQLPEGILVIADAQLPVAIAGIMGGLDSEVTASTKRIVLESALFDLVSIRRSSRLLGLRSDASARFDKGLDPAGVYHALARAAYLLKCCNVGQTLLVGTPPRFSPTTEIALRPERVNSLLGTSLTGPAMEAILTRLGFGVTATGDNYQVLVPSRRRDITGEIDLVEEIGRIHGFENIPTLTMTGTLSQGSLTPKQRMLRLLRQRVLGAGLNEIMTLSFYDPSFGDTLGLTSDHPWNKPIVLQNPLSRERSTLRPSLVPGMIEVLNHNQARQTAALACFEIGAAFEAYEQPIIKQPMEHLKISLGAYGLRRGNWGADNLQLDFFYLKGIVESLAPTAVFVPSHHVFLHPGRQADILIDGEVVGLLGEVHPRVGMRERTVVGELDLLKAIKLDFALPHYIGMSRFLPVERDMAFVIDSSIPAGDVMAVIEKSGGELLRSVVLFDVYTGQNLPQGMVSLAFRMEFAKSTGTLTENDLNDAQREIRQAVEQSFKASLRS